MLESALIILVAGCSWAVIIRRWRMGLFILVCYIPVAGAISLLAYPRIWPKLITDFAIIIPMYLAWYADVSARRRTHNLPRFLLVAMALLAIVVCAQSFNPMGLNWKTRLIGIKVWLFYLPLLAVGFTWLTNKDALRSLLRVLMITLWVPNLVCFTQFLGIHYAGYETTMRFMYGAAAADSTQNFSVFILGSGRLFRLPGTFSFPSQYLNFLLVMITLATTFTMTEENRAWRRFGWLSLYAAVFASYLTGTRAAYLLTPSLVLLIGLNTRSWVKTMTHFIACLCLVFVALKMPEILCFVDRTCNHMTHHENPPVTVGPAATSQDKTSFLTTTSTTVNPIASGQPISAPATTKAPEVIPSGPQLRIGIDMKAWWVMMGQLVTSYPREIGYDEIINAARTDPFGRGTGTNTGAARYAIPNRKLYGYENYYAKAIVETGIFGLLIIIFLYGSVLYYVYVAWSSLSDQHLRILGGAIWSLLILFVIYDFKSCVIDLDPINMYFWLLAGLVLSLPRFENSQT